MKCPNCDNVLQPVDYEGIKIETCDGCRGEWLDAGELAHIVKAREARFNAEERKAITAATGITPVNLEDRGRRLTCPNCGGQTEALNYGGNSGIIIDRCAHCRGVWLDEGELEKIQMVAESWQDGLPDHLARHGARLREIADEVEQGGGTKVSRFGFVNAIINGVLDRVL